jgi:phage baseplate assembly protein W
MGSISFKSVGKTREKSIQDSTVVEQTPTMYGIKTPLRLGSSYVFDVTYSLAEQVADNLRNLILTNHGERVGLINYGANLRSILTDFVDLEDFDTKAIQRISTAIQTWMPYIQPQEFVSNPDRTKSGGKVAAIRIMITYNVPTLEISGSVLEVTLYVP